MATLLLLNASSAGEDLISLINLRGLIRLRLHRRDRDGHDHAYRGKPQNHPTDGIIVDNLGKIIICVLVGGSENDAWQRQN